MAGLGKRILSGATYIGIAGIIVYICGMLRGVAVARIIDSQSEMGIIAIFNSVQEMMVAIAILGISSAVARYIAVNRNKGSEFSSKYVTVGFSLSVILSLIISVIYLISTDYLANGLYGKPELLSMFRIGSFTLIFSAGTSFGLAVLQGYERIKSIAFRNVLVAIAQVTFTIIFTWQYGIFGVALGGLVGGIASVIVLISAIIPLLKTENVKLAMDLDKETSKEMLHFSLPLFFSQFVLLPAMLFMYSYTFTYLGEDQTGLLKIGLNIRNVILSFSALLAIPLLPILSDTYSKSRKKFLRIVPSLLRLMLLIALPFTIFALIFIKSMIELLYGGTYSDSWQIASFLIFNAYLFSLSPILGPALKAIGKTMPIFGFDVVLGITLVITSLIFIQFYGLIGMGLGFIVSAIAILIVEFWYLKKYYRMRFRRLRQPFTLSIFSFLAVYLISQYFESDYLLLINLLLIAVVSYLSYASLTKKEKVWIKTILSSLRK